MDNKELVAEALLSFAPDLDGDHQIEPTVVVVGDVPTYEDKVPDEYDERISGKQVDVYMGHPIIQFSPRAAIVDDKKGGLVLSDGHLGGSKDYPEELPAEFEHFISRQQYVAAVIYQKGSDDPRVDRDKVRVKDTGSIELLNDT